MPPAGFSLGASDLCTYKNQKKEIYENQSYITYFFIYISYFSPLWGKRQGK